MTRTPETCYCLPILGSEGEWDGEGDGEGDGDGAGDDGTEGDGECDGLGAGEGCEGEGCAGCGDGGCVMLLHIARREPLTSVHRVRSGRNSYF